MAEKEDVLGEAALKQIRPLFEGLETSERLQPYMLGKFQAEFNAEVDVIRGHQALIMSGLTPEAQADLTRDLDLLPVVGRATVWVESQYGRQTIIETAYQKLVGEVIRVRKAGMKGLRVLEEGGAVTTEKARAIRKGTGYVDAAQDVQVLGPLLGGFWSELEPLQKLQTDPELRLTPELIASMVPLGTKLIEADKTLKHDNVDFDWREDLLRCQVLLERTWDSVRFQAVGGYGRSRLWTLATQGYPSVRSMYYRL